MQRVLLAHQPAVEPFPLIPQNRGEVSRHVWGEGMRQTHRNWSSAFVFQRALAC